jgi:hypothetical protein
VRLGMNTGLSLHNPLYHCTRIQAEDWVGRSRYRWSSESSSAFKTQRQIHLQQIPPLDVREKNPDAGVYFTLYVPLCISASACLQFLICELMHTGEHIRKDSNFCTDKLVRMFRKITSILLTDRQSRSSSISTSRTSAGKKPTVN